MYDSGVLCIVRPRRRMRIQAAIMHMVRAKSPPSIPSMTGPTDELCFVRGCELFVVLVVGKLAPAELSENPMTELNTSIAANWPHGSIEGIGGPVQVGVYQLVSGYLA